MTIRTRGKRRSLRPAQIARAVDEGRESLDLYLDEISRVPLLNREEEMELARRAFKGDVLAQERLARHNVRFVVSVAKKFQNRGVPLVDLIGEAQAGVTSLAEPAELGSVSVVLHGRVHVDPAPDERTGGKHPAPAPGSDVVQGEPGDRRADPLALVSAVHLGVGEGDHVVAEGVGRKPGQDAVHVALVALLVRGMADLDTLGHR